MIHKIYRKFLRQAGLVGDAYTRKLLVDEFDKKRYLRLYLSRVDFSVKNKALNEAAEWLLFNQEANTQNAGFCTYYLKDGFTSAYPETTGYIVPTLLRYADFSGKAKFRESARKALDWLLDIQKPEGGWQGGYLHQNRPPIVFNTAQVVRGMLAGYHAFGDEKFLDAATRAGDWILDQMDDRGVFVKNIYLNAERVYETYSLAPLLELGNILDTEKFAEAALKNAQWVLNKKMHGNGWLEDADNTLHKNHKPILHTLAYTYDGLVDIALSLNHSGLLNQTLTPVRFLASQMLERGTLNGRYDQNWKGTEALITTGVAQMAIVWHKLFLAIEDSFFEQAHVYANTLLTAIHQRSVVQKRETNGALFGSFPLWGKYEPYGCPNWATKYFMDSLMLELTKNGK